MTTATKEPAPKQHVGPLASHVNRLADETSPYLLQHAANPVAWRPWGEEAFAQARREDKPIFLSIGYSACHWCHVMERESFEDEGIADILNQEFVSVKVDREERPDVDRIYMNAVQIMTGSGGWPLSVFLTPDLKPFFGGTYFPAQDRFGRPRFRTVLLEIAKLWQTGRDRVVGNADVLAQAVRNASRPAGAGDAEPDVELLHKATRSLSSSFDINLGGFGGPPKFPPSGAVALLLRQYRRTGYKMFLHMVELTLDRMASGGMYDHLGGGFHRYSVDAKWLVPHFEKMLYDNALLAMVYMDAYLVTKKPLYHHVATQALDYVMRDMTDPAGGFHSSEDADSEGHEGKYYVWSHDEIRRVLGVEDARFFSQYYGVTRAGNFEGKNILNVPTGPYIFAEQEGIPVRQLEGRLAGLRSRLLQQRLRRVRPRKDDKVIASWNGLMISAFAKGYATIGDERFLRAAERAAGFILSSMKPNGRLMHTYREGRAKLPGNLDDYAFVANAMLDLYEASFEVKWLTAAERLTKSMTALFWDERDHGFFFTAAGRKDLLARAKTYHDGAIPSGNAAAALALLRLGRLTGEQDHLARAEELLQAAAPVVDSHPAASLRLLCALDFRLGPPKEIVVVGRTGAVDANRLLKAARAQFAPNKVLAFLDPDAPGAAELKKRIPLLGNRIAKSGAATAYVCENYACQSPVTDPKELAALLRGATPTANDSAAKSARGGP